MLYRPSKICDFFACLLRLSDKKMCPVWLSDMVALFGHCTLGPLDISVISVRTGRYSIRQ